MISSGVGAWNGRLAGRAVRRRDNHECMVDRDLQSFGACNAQHDCHILRVVSQALPWCSYRCRRRVKYCTHRTPPPCHAVSTSPIIVRYAICDMLCRVFMLQLMRVPSGTVHSFVSKTSTPLGTQNPFHHVSEFHCFK